MLSDEIRKDIEASFWILDLMDHTRACNDSLNMCVSLSCMAEVPGSHQGAQKFAIAGTCFAASTTSCSNVAAVRTN